MHPRIAELLIYIDAQAELLRDAFDSIPEERRGIRPAPDRWSAAESVHHVTIVERRLTMRLAGMIEQARALPPETDETSLFPMARAALVEVRAARFRTSDASEPRDTNSTTVWREFEEARRQLKDVIATGDGLDLGEVSAPHPALGAFTAYEWIAFAGSHAARHADQIREDCGAP